MPVIIPDRLWETPDRITPGKKPSGNVVIDRELQLARNLRSFFFFNGKNVVDVARLVPQGIIDVNGSELVSGGCKKGQSLIFDGSVSNEVEVNDLGTNYQFSIAGDWSILYHVRYDGVSRAAEYDLSTVNAAALGGTEGHHVTSQTWSAGEYKTILVSLKQGVSFSVHINGESVLSEASSNDRFTHQIRYDHNATTLEIGIGIGSSANLIFGGTNQKTTDRFAGHFISAATWHRAFNDSEGKEITRNPYQIVIPA